MTRHPHDLGSHVGHHPIAPTGATHVDERPKLPPWVIPAAAVGVVVVALLVSGVLSPTLLLYGGLLAGCGLMHLFGHGGHGGHSGNANGGESGSDGPSSAAR